MTDDTDGKKPKPDYEVGYCRPPRETRFQPGRSGNPKGRKRKPRSLKDQTERVLAMKMSVREGEKTKKLPRTEVILRKLANMAAMGDLKAVELLFKLLNSPEHADTDVIVQDSLSAEDRAMLHEVMAQIMGPDGSGEADLSDPVENESTGNAARADHDSGAGGDVDDG